MEMWIKKIAVAGCILIALDLGFINLNKKMYEYTVINVQRVVMVPKYAGIFVAYFFILVILYWFILRQRRPIWEAALLGMAVNGIYESTNYTMFKKWPLDLAIIDTLWGGVLYGLTTAAVYHFL
jgi:uncharacterized membrane protein